MTSCLLLNTVYFCSDLTEARDRHCTDWSLSILFKDISLYYIFDYIKEIFFSVVVVGCCCFVCFVFIEGLLLLFVLSGCTSGGIYVPYIYTRAR